jgi:hypothetical protein
MIHLVKTALDVTLETSSISNVSETMGYVPKFSQYFYKYN